MSETKVGKVVFGETLLPTLERTEETRECLVKLLEELPRLITLVKQLDERMSELEHRFSPERGD